MLNLHLFGSLAAWWENAGCAVEPISLTARPGSLLAFLALSRGHFFSRAELLATLWGERHDSGTTGCFNTTLWRLRKAVERSPMHAGELITCDHHGAVGIPQNAHLVLDVAEFEALVAPSLGKPIDRLDANDVERLREGVAYYKEDILTGYTDEWALREREKLRRHHMNALGRLMQLSNLARDHSGAIGYAQSILDRDILREDIHCELIRLLLKSGQRALALRQFERCRDALRRELAIQPMRETMALYQQIAEHAVGHEPAGAPIRHYTSVDPQSPVAPVAEARSATYLKAEPAMDAAQSIDTARQHLALADEHLRRTLQLVTPPSHTSRSV